MKRARSKDRTLLIGSWIVMSGILFAFVPRRNSRQAIVPFFFMQFLTWIFGLIVVENKLITYPRRLFFTKVNQASFTFEFFIFPATCVLFNLYYPRTTSLIRKAIYYSAYIFTLTGLEVFAKINTKTIRYMKWKWQYSFVSMWIFFYFSRLYYRWFFKEEPISSSRKKDENDTNI
ncbi:CBO0543 family protein [Evansella sp. AB-rgal1]|uniref:CBO0543 family protein n=1 Tax=Evansella sp. AB-rgal1 TaxID=3242696 RepID=UPI00359DB4B0